MNSKMVELKKVFLSIKNRIKKFYQYYILYYNVTYDYGYINSSDQVNDLYLKINKHNKHNKHNKQEYSNDKKDKFIFIGDKNLHSIMRVAVFGDVDQKNVKKDCTFFTTRQLKNKRLKLFHDKYFKINKKIPLPFKNFFEKRYTTSTIKDFSEYNVFFIFLAGAYFEETFSQPYLWKQIQSLAENTFVHKILYLVDPVDKFPSIKYWFPFFDLISGYALEDVEKYGLTYINAPCVFFRDLKKTYNVVTDLHIRAQGREKTIKEIYDRLSSLGIKCDFHIQVKNPDDYCNTEGLEFTQTRISYDEMLNEEMKSNVLLEVVVPNVGSGATLRYKEAIMYNKKLLTNNPTYNLLPYTESDNIRYFKDVEDIDVEWLKRKDTIDYGYNGDFSVDTFLGKIKEESIKHKESETQ